MCATHELLHLRLGRPAAERPVGAVAAAGGLLGGLRTRVCSGGRPLPGNLPRRRWFWFSAIAVAMVFFVARNVP